MQNVKRRDSIVTSQAESLGMQISFKTIFKEIFDYSFSDSPRRETHLNVSLAISNFEKSTVSFYPLFFDNKLSDSCIKKNKCDLPNTTEYPIFHH